MRTAAHPNPCSAGTRVIIPNTNPGGRNRTTNRYAASTNGDSSAGDRNQRATDRDRSTEQYAGAANVDTGTTDRNQASTDRNGSSEQYAAPTNAN